MNQIICRIAKTEDLPVLLEFEQGIIRIERPFDPTLDKDPISYYDIKKLIFSNDAEVIVAVDGTKIVGSAYVKIKKAAPYLKHENYAYLGFMFVEPEYRGRGINRMIIEELHTWTKSRNLTEVRLEVYNDNDSALRAYEKAGFKRHMITMRIGLD